MNFKQYLNEAKQDTYLIDEIVNEYSSEVINEFFDYLQNYMEFNDKAALAKIEQLCKKYPLFQSFKAKRVYRVMAIPEGSDPEKGIPLDDFAYISTSTAKLKGKPLEKIVGDNLDRYEYYNKIKGEMIYVQFNDVVGINIYEIVKHTLKKESNLNMIADSDIKDTFKRLKAEKEFMVINKNVKPNNIEKVSI